MRRAAVSRCPCPWPLAVGPWPLFGRTAYQMRPDSVCAHQLPRAPVGRTGTAALLHVGLELAAELLQERLHWRGGGIAEGAERLAGDVVGDRHEQVEVAHPTLAGLDLPEQLEEPVAALAARRALPARFVTVEV